MILHHSFNRFLSLRCRRAWSRAAGGWAALLLAVSAMSAAPGCAPAPSRAGDAAIATDAPDGTASILVFTRTEGFRHDSIPTAIATLRSLADDIGADILQTEDPAVFSEDILRTHDVVVFANTTGPILDPAQRAAFERWLAGGGAFVGVHSAADTAYDWPFYGELVGAWFASHPPGLQRAQVRFEHDAVEAAFGPWVVEDELYNYRRNPRPHVDVIATLQARTDDGGTMGDDHPIAWCHDRLGGRAWYTGLGHDEAIYADPVFRAHLLAGLRYVLGTAERCDELPSTPTIMSR